MGSICSKGSKKNDVVVEAISIKEGTGSSLSRFINYGKKEAVVPAANADKGDPIVDNLEKKTPASKTSGHGRSITVDACANGKGPGSKVSDGGGSVLGIADMPNSYSAEHVIAGWPSWLTSVAAEVVSGWLPRKANSFERLDKIGQGTYSSVYKARDLETGKIVALKKVRFVSMDPESVRFMAREIRILRRLSHPNVIKLEGIVASRMSGSIYLVFEYMEHDLAGLLTRPGTKFTNPQVKCFMKQLLSGLDHCHSQGILHRDIKGSNLLVGDNGVLRIGDFGLATVFDPNKRQPLTSRVVTLWYRPPELLLGATEYGAAVDLWSSGCILAELLLGKPIMPGRTEVEQLHKIFKLCGSPAEDYWKKSKLSNATIFKPQKQYPRRLAETYKDFPSSALSLLDTLLAIEPADRRTAASALQSEFFNTKPFPCDPSSLPKFPPSKEYDTRLREVEAKRQKEEALQGQGAEPAINGSKGPPSKQQNDNLEAQKRQRNNKSSRENRHGHAGSTVHPGAYGNLRRKNMGESEHGKAPGRSVSTLKSSHGPKLRTRMSYINHYGETGDYPNLAGLVSERRQPRYRSDKHHALDRPAASLKKDDRGVKDSDLVYGNSKKIMHYSGPLMPPGGNMEDMLKEHERLIQEAVRKARDKDKTNNF